MKPTEVLLVHPPVVKPSEPPPGLATLAGALRHHRIPCSVIDANIEGLLFLLERNPAAPAVARDSRENPSDTWIRRARRNLDSHLRLIRSRRGCDRISRYQRAVHDINRVLETSASPGSVRLSLSDYEDPDLSPVRSSDLIRAAESPADNPFYGYFRKRFLPHLEKNPPAIIGLSLNYLSQALCCFAMIGFLKGVASGTRVVLGGGLVTSWMRRPDWHNPFRGLVDDCVAGPGEDFLLSMLGMAATDEPAAPAYGDFPLRDYLSPGLVLPYSASRGCYWRRCAFCPEKAEGNPYRPAPVTRVLRDLHSIRAETEPVLLHFLDNALGPALLRSLAGESVGIPWYGFARITSELADPAFCRALKQSGCVMLKLGLESGSQRVLDHLQKGIDLSTASRVLGTLKEAGIATYIYLLFGTPAEGEADAEQTLDFAVRHHEGIGFLNVAIFNLPAHGADAGNLETESFYDGDLSLYRGFVHPAGWGRTSVRRFLDRTFRRHPAVAPILRRDPPYFTSNHAAFFSMKTAG